MRRPILLVVLASAALAQPPRPTLRRLDPGECVVRKGDLVRVRGEGLFAATRVLADGRPTLAVRAAEEDGSSLALEVLEGTPHGVVTLTVEGGDGELELGVVLPPRIDAVSPFASPGSALVIDGANLTDLPTDSSRSDGDRVTLDGAPLRVVWSHPRRMVCHTPAGCEPGLRRVAVSNRAGSAGREVEVSPPR